MDESSSTWPAKRIGSFATVKRGASPRPIDNPRWFSYAGPGWVRIRDVTAAGDRLRHTQDHLSSEGASRSVRVGPGDVIMSIAATIGLSIIVEMDARIHDGFVKISPDSSVDPEFLVRLLRHSKARFVASGQTGTQSNINSRIVADTTVRLPPMDEQRRIVEVLDAFDETIHATKRVVAKIWQQHEGLAVELMTNCAPELIVADIVEQRRPVTYGIVQPGPRQREGVGVPIIRGQDYNNGIARTQGLYWVRPSIAASYSRSVVCEGDLLLSIVGVYVGTVGQVPRALDGANLTQTTARIAVDHRYASRFFFHQMIAPRFQAEVGRFTKGSAQPGLNLADVERMRVVVPDVTEQERIADALDASLTAIATETAALQKLREARDGVASDLLSGRVRTVAL